MGLKVEVLNELKPVAIGELKTASIYERVGVFMDLLLYDAEVSINKLNMGSL